MLTDVPKNSIVFYVVFTKIIGGIYVMRKRALSVLLAAAMSVSLIACGSSSSGTTTAAADSAAETGCLLYTS